MSRPYGWDEPDFDERRALQRGQAWIVVVLRLLLAAVVIGVVVGYLFTRGHS